MLKSPGHSSSLVKSLSALWGTLHTRRKIQFSLLLVLMTIGSVIEALSIGSILPFLGALTKPDRIFSSETLHPILQILDITEPRQLQFTLAVLFATMALLAGGVRLALLWINIRLGHAVGADISNEIYRRTLYSPYIVHLARNSSEIIAGISTKSSQVVQCVILPLLTVISACLILISIVFALFSIDPHIAATAFGGFGIVYIFVLRLTYVRLTVNGRRYNEGITRVFKVLQEGLGGIKDVLIDGTQEIHSKIFHEADLSHRRADANIAILGNSPRYVIESLGLVLLAALAFIFSGRTGGIIDLIPVLGALALGSIRLLSALQQAYSAWAAMSGSNAALRDVIDLLQQPLPEYVSMPSPKVMPFNTSIDLCGVNFRYQREGTDVLTGVDLTIPKGSRVGFVGATGSGKSTLVDVIMGLLPPSIGALKIDGEVVSDSNLRSWQMRIAHVPQFIFLTDASIAENIAFGVPAKDIDIERVRMSAQQAQLSETIESWDHQYETKVGERGVRLSGGQRQRIGIARALYKHADVIVFDEATSALDTKTEDAVMKAIYSLSPELTIILIAHRHTTLKECTYVVELSGGVIKRAGTFDEILIDGDRSSAQRNPQQ